MRDSPGERTMPADDATRTSAFIRGRCERVRTASPEVRGDGRS